MNIIFKKHWKLNFKKTGIIILSISPHVANMNEWMNEYLKSHVGEFLGCPVVRTWCFQCQGWVRSLVRELRYWKSCGVAKEKKKYCWLVLKIAVVWVEVWLQSLWPEVWALRMPRMEPTALFINWCPWSLKGVRFSFHIHPGGQWGLSSRWFIHSADIHWVPTTCQALLGGGDREALLFQSLYSNVWKWWTLFPENQWVNLSSTHTYTHGCSLAHSCCGVGENPAHWISSTISWVQKAYSSSLPSGGLCLLPMPPPGRCSGLPLSTLCCFG